MDINSSAVMLVQLLLVPGETLCLRAKGAKYAQRGSLAAESFNDFVNSVEGLDSFSTGGGLGFVVGSSIGGLTDAGGGGYAPYPSGFTCDGSNWIPDDVVYGTHKTRFHGLSDALDADGSPFGSYFFDTTFNPPLSVRDTAERDLYLSADDTALPACSGAPKTAHDANAAGDFPFDITPLGNYNPSFIPFGMLAGGTLDPAAQYFGGHVLRSGYSYGYNAGVGAEFGFSGVGFAPAGFLTRLRDGAEILEAWALIRAVGLKICSWSQVFDLQPNGDLHLEYTRDDASIEYDGPVTGGPVTTFDPGTPAGSSGSISLALVGRVRDSRNIRLVGGGTYPLAANTFQHLGSGLSISTVDADVFKKVSVKEAIQKLVATRNSLAADYELWPTVATVEPDDGAGALAGFLRGLMPVCSATLIPGSGSTWGYTSTQAGRYAIIPQGIEISAIRVRFRLPSGILADDVIATPQSAMIPGWS